MQNHANQQSNVPLQSLSLINNWVGCIFSDCGLIGAAWRFTVPVK
jgi:hypothetical protein